MTLVPYGIAHLIALLLFFSTPAFAVKSCQVLQVQGEVAQTFLVVRAGRIQSISEIPPKHSQSCAVFDLGKATLLPGLIDGHTHLLTTDRSFGRDFATELLHITAEPMAERIKLGEKYAREMLRAGITSVRDLGNSGQFQDVLLKKRIAASEAEGPRMFVSGPGISVAPAQFPLHTPAKLVGREYRIISDSKEAKRIILDYERPGNRADLIKLYADNDPSPLSMPLDWMRHLIRFAHTQNFLVTAHATNPQSAANAVAAGVDSLEHGYEISESTLEEMAKKKIILVPTDFSFRVCSVISSHTSDPRPRDCHSYIQERSRRLLRAQALGVPIAFGSDMYIDLPGELANRGVAAKETLYAYVEEGMTDAQAIEAATINAARLLGRKDLGRLEPGSIADIIAARGNPRQRIRDLEKVFFVMKAGKLICGPGRPCSLNEKK